MTSDSARALVNVGFMVGHCRYAFPLASQSDVRVAGTGTEGALLTDGAFILADQKNGKGFFL